MLRTLIVASLLSLAPLSFAATLKIATAAPEGTAYLREMRAAGEAIKTQTTGRVEFKFFPGAVMGTDAATVLRKIKLGQLQGGAFSGAELSSVSRDGAVYGLPFLFASKAEFDFVQAKVNPLLRQNFAAGGMVVPGICGGGYAYLLSSKPLTNLEDLKATKVWTPSGDPIAQVAFKIAGAATVPLSLGDVYTSLQTGLVETIGGPLAAVIGFQWHTKVKHMADVPLAVTVGFLAFDKRAFEKLTPADQALVNTEVGKAFAKLNDLNFDDAAARAALVKQGIAIAKPSVEEALAWNAVGDKTIVEVRKKALVSDAVLDAVLAARKEFRANSVAK